MSPAVGRDMRHLLPAFAIASAVTLSHAGSARADETNTPRATEHLGNRAAHGAGVALTVTGSVFLGCGLVAGTGGIILAATATNSEGGGLSVAFAAVGGLIWAGASIIGVATLVPGILLMTKNASRPQPVFHDARNDPPAPKFVSVPILSGTF